MDPYGAFAFRVDPFQRKTSQNGGTFLRRHRLDSRICGPIRVFPAPVVQVQVAACKVSL